MTGAGFRPVYRGGAPSLPVLSVCGTIGRMGRPWTAVEDAAIRQSAAVGFPTLRVLAVDCGRSYVAIRLRASHLRAIRLPRVDPAQGAARGPTEILCRYCGGAFLARGGVRYCGGVCRTLARGQCPGCGRALIALQCSRCATDGKRADWPGRVSLRPNGSDTSGGGPYITVGSVETD